MRFPLEFALAVSATPPQSCPGGFASIGRHQLWLEASKSVLACFRQSPVHITCPRWAISIGLEPHGHSRVSAQTSSAHGKQNALALVPHLFFLGGPAGAHQTALRPSICPTRFWRSYVINCSGNTEDNETEDAADDRRRGL